MKIKKVGLPVALALAISSCGTNSNQTATAPASENDALILKMGGPPTVPLNLDMSQTQFPIDASVTGEDRAELLKIMQHLPVEQRENLIVISGDKIISNKKALKNELEVLKSVDNGFFRNSRGQIVTLPEHASMVKTDGLLNSQAGINTCQGDGNGPFIRHAANTGFSYMRSDVILPGGFNTNLPAYPKNVYSGDTGYVYAGGQSATGNSVDAGFQYGGLNNDWAPFLTSSYLRQADKTNNTTIYNAYVSSPNSIRYTPGNAKITFYTNYDSGGQGSVVLFVEGTNRSTNLTESRTLYFNYLIPGWSVGGSGIILKRVTSIAQNQGAENFSSGYFMSGAKWINPVVATSYNSANGYWWDTSADQNFCTNPTYSSKIEVFGQGTLNETNSIYLNR